MGTDSDIHEHCDLTLSPTESRLADLWDEVLQMLGRPTATDDFFSLGGDSMAMVLVEFRIKEEFSIELTPGAILETPRLCDLAAVIDSASIRQSTATAGVDRISNEISEEIQKTS